MTTIISTVDAKEQFSDLLNRVTLQKERIILTRRGKEIAALVPLEDLALLQESRDKIDLQDATEALKQARSGGAVPLETLKEEIGC